MLTRVICADARIATSFDLAFGDSTGVASLLLADPPYLLLDRRRRFGDIRSASARPRKLDEEGVIRFRDEAAYNDFSNAWMKTTFARVAPGGTVAIWTNALGRRATLAAANSQGWTCLVAEFAWAKRTLERSAASTSLEETARIYERALILTRGESRPLVTAALDGLAALTGYASKSGHPHEKPFAVIAPIVRSLSKRGDSVLVPFAGCGGEAASAARLGRNVLALEIRKEWADQAVYRSSDSGATWTVQTDSWVRRYIGDLWHPPLAVTALKSLL